MSKITICLDPGHGGRDPGAVGQNGLFEKDVVLNIGRQVAQILDDEFNIILTRSDDRFLAIAQRPRIAIDQDADMFISLHCNAFANRAVHGLETFFWSGNHQGRRLASMVNIQLATDTGWRDRGVKHTNVFGVLRRLPAFPACLIEYNFISNPEFEQRFRDPKVLNLLARSTATGIRNYSRLYF